MPARATDRQVEIMRSFGLGEEDVAEWRASGLPDDAFEDWLTDRVARKPTGSRAREVYGAEGVHDFARRAILDALALRPGERLLEIGSGGGLLLRDALDAGASAVGLERLAWRTCGVPNPAWPRRSRRRVDGFPSPGGRTPPQEEGRPACRWPGTRGT
jgi:hypothetical protein